MIDEINDTKIMMNELPSPSELEYFGVLARVGHITRASEQIGITQPSLSSALKRLEEKLGAELFIRTKKGVELTEAGRKFLDSSTELLRSYQLLKSQVHSTEEKLRSSYRFGIHPSVAIICLPQCLPDIQKKFPEFSLSIHHDLSRKINERIIAKDLDFGIVVNPKPHPDLVLKKICLDEVKIWKGRAKNSNTIIYDPNLFQSSYVISELKKISKSSERYTNFLQVSSLELIRELGLSGAGDVILPSRVANRPGQAKSFKELSKTPIYKDEFNLVWHSGSRLNPIEKNLLRNFHKILKRKLN